MSNLFSGQKYPLAGVVSAADDEIGNLARFHGTYQLVRANGLSGIPCCGPDSLLLGDAPG